MPVDLDDDHGGLSELGQTARAAFKEEEKLLKDLMERKYVRREDLAQFLGAGKELRTLKEVIEAEVKRAAPNILSAGARAQQHLFGRTAAAGSEAAWEQVSDEKRRCRLTLPEAPHRYAWSAARQGVANTSPVDALEPWYELQQGNPLLEFANVKNVMTGAVHIPQVTTGAVSKNGNVPDAPAAPVGATIKGSLTQMDVYDLTSQVPLGPSRWIMGIESALMLEHMQRHGFAQGADTIAAVKLANSGATKVKTGQAAKLPPAADLPGKLASMLAGVKGFYRMGAGWQANETLEAVLFSLFSSAGYAVPLESGIRQLLGFPWRTNSHADEGSTAGDLACLGRECSQAPPPPLFPGGTTGRFSLHPCRY